MKPIIIPVALFLMTACSGITSSTQSDPGNFPSVSSANAAKFNTTPCSANPASRSQNPRVGPVNLANGYSGHVVKVCADGALVENVIFWSRTNAAATDIDVAITKLSGQRVPHSADSVDLPSTTNYFRFQTQDSTDAPLNCEIIKPARGISPAALALCSS